MVGGEHFEVLAAGRRQRYPHRLGWAAVQERTPSAGAASSGWWVSTKMGRPMRRRIRCWRQGSGPSRFGPQHGACSFDVFPGQAPPMGRPPGRCWRLRALVPSEA